MSSPENVWSRGLSRLVALAIALSIGLTVIGTLAADDCSDIAVAAATAGIQLGAITLIGFALNRALGQLNTARAEQQKQADLERAKRQKQADVDREERRRLHEYRMMVFRDAVEAYNNVKGVRRALRAVRLPISSDGVMRPDQIGDFNAQMRALNEAELAFEMVEREIGAQSERFASASARTKDLEQVKDYLRDVLRAWESGALLTTTHDREQEESLSKLRNFLAKRSEVGDEMFWGSFDSFEEAIRADLLSDSPAPHPALTAGSAASRGRGAT